MPIISGQGGGGGGLPSQWTVDPDTGSLTIQPDLNEGSASLNLQSGNDAFSNLALTAPGASATLLSGIDSTPALLRWISANGYFIVRTHAAPADGELTTGDAALWFDQTNGAAKLMVKAKQADGTVVTAAIALA